MSEKAEQAAEQPPEGGFFTPEGQEEAVAEAEEKAERGEDPTPTIEELARSMGWYEMEGGKTAYEYIHDTADINRSLRSRIERMDTQIESLVQNTAKQTMAALKAQRERLQKQFDEAVESGDKVAASKASKAIGELDRDKPDEQVSQREEMIRKWQPHATSFEQANAEALKDSLAKSEAMEIIERMANQGHSPEETYRAVERKLRRDYPEYYTNQNRERPAKVGGDKRPSSADKSAWGKLISQEPDAEGVFKQMVEDGVYKSDTKENREKFAKLALED